MLPSLQTNLEPEQWETPPFLPLQGVFAANTAVDNIDSEKKVKSIFFIIVFPKKYLNSKSGFHFIELHI